jgi:hypothetical protein
MEGRKGWEGEGGGGREGRDGSEREEEGGKEGWEEESYHVFFYLSQMSRSAAWYSIVKFSSVKHSAFSATQYGIILQYVQ